MCDYLLAGSDGLLYRLNVKTIWHLLAQMAMVSSSPSLQPEGEKWAFNNVWKRFWFSVGEEKYWIQHHLQHLKTDKNNILHVSVCTCVFVSQTCAFILHQTSLFLLVVLVRSIVVCVCVHMCVRVPVRVCVAVAGDTICGSKRQYLFPFGPQW